MGIRIVPATFDQAQYIGVRLRLADQREIDAKYEGAGDYVFEVTDSLENSRWCNVVTLDDEPILIYGVAPSQAMPHWGCPWMLATDKMLKLRRRFIKESIDEVELMLVSYPFLHNLVHTKNMRSIKWLSWLGFTIDFEKRHGPNDDFLFFFKGNP